ncbi:hypothetical protein B0H13DRAFT_2144615 [Mycena leptocephala]|nr:hypothetical protein B0H13DRAFT_2144615 [Mycena leptocephala]
MLCIHFQVFPTTTRCVCISLSLVACFPDLVTGRLLSSEINTRKQPFCRCQTYFLNVQSQSAIRFVRSRYFVPVFNAYSRGSHQRKQIENREFAMSHSSHPMARQLSSQWSVYFRTCL